MVLVAEDAGLAEEARVRLARVGRDKTVGYLHDGVHAWQQAGLPLDDIPQISVLQLYEQLSEQPDAVQVIDVRRPGEWAAGHIEHAQLKPLHKLPTLLDDLSPQKPNAVLQKWIPVVDWNQPDTACGIQAGDEHGRRLRRVGGPQTADGHLIKLTVERVEGAYVPPAAVWGDDPQQGQVWPESWN